MMKKTILSVYIPSLNKSCDFSIPSNMCIHNVIKLIGRIVSEEFWGQARTPENLSLAKLKTGKVLNNALSLAQLGIVDGEQLILI